MMADGMAKNSGTAVRGPVGSARLEVVGDGPGGVFREELARPVVPGRLGAHPPGPQVSLAAQVGVRQLRVDAAVVYVLAPVGPSLVMFSGTCGMVTPRSSEGKT